MAQGSEREREKEREQVAARPPMHRVKYCGRKAEAESNMISLARLRSHAGDFQLPSRSSSVVRPRPSTRDPGRIFSTTQLCNQQTALRPSSERERGLSLIDRAEQHLLCAARAAPIDAPSASRLAKLHKEDGEEERDSSFLFLPPQ